MRAESAKQHAYGVIGYIEDAKTAGAQSLREITAATAAQKAPMAEDAWNTRDPARVAP